MSIQLDFESDWLARMRACAELGTVGGAPGDPGFGLRRLGELAEEFYDLTYTILLNSGFKRKEANEFARKKQQSLLTRATAGVPVHGKGRAREYWYSRTA